MINSHENGPDIKREQVKQPPDLTDDTREHRRAEARYGLSIPIMVSIVFVIFVVAFVIIIWTV